MPRPTTEMIGTLEITDDQRQQLYEIIQNNPYVGFKSAARRVGLQGSGKQIKETLAQDDDFQDVLHEARGDMFEQAGLGVVKLLGYLGEIASKEGPSQLRAVTEALALQGVHAARQTEVDIKHDGELRIVVESAFPDVIDGEVTEEIDDDGAADHPALPG